MARQVLLLAVGLLFISGEARADRGHDRRAARGAERPTCKAAYGSIKCGFDCKAGYGRIECAKTPHGICSKGRGTVACWDPQLSRREMRRARRTLRQSNPRAACVARGGTVACGYNCVARYGRSKCSRTPFGTCTAAYGRIRCWDPPWARVPRGRPVVSDARPRCVSAYGRTKCGFGCMAKYGRIECAQQPGARCVSAYGCIKCGYGCVAKYGQIQCAKSPHGVCKAGYGKVTCWDPQ